MVASVVASVVGMSDAYEEVVELDEQADDAFVQRHGETCGRCFEQGLDAGELCPACGLPI